MLMLRFMALEGSAPKRALNSNRNSAQAGWSAEWKLAHEKLPELPGRSRTQGTELLNAPRYRFFFATAAKFCNANFPPRNALRQALFGSSRQCRDHSPDALTCRAWQYPGNAAPGCARRMLLPMCGIKTGRRLRKNLRPEKIRFPLVGKELRETAHAYSRARLQRRPALPASRPGGTRPRGEVLSPNTKF